MAQESTVQGGWFYTILGWIGLADSDGLRLKRCIPALVGLCWLPLFVLTAVSGTARGDTVDVPFLADLSTYGRFLIGLPLLLVGERVVGTKLSAVFSHFRAANLIREDQQSEVDAIRARSVKRRDSGGVELLLLVIAFGLPWISLNAAHDAVDLTGISGWALETSAGSSLTMAGWWYVAVAIPLVAFIALRLAWRYITWALFLRSMARLDLRLKPTHPDRMGGLNPLVIAQSTFTLFLLVGSVILAAMMGNDVLHSGATITSLYPEIATWIGIALMLLAGPLMVFAPMLRRTKLSGLLDYGRVADSLTETFSERWRTKDASGMIDTGDPSAVADFGAMYEAVSQMRSFPFSLRQLAAIAIVLLIPFTPLLLTAMSIKQLLTRLLGIVM